MIQTALIQNAHNDLVTDAAYDMYGIHLATCGLDQKQVLQPFLPHGRRADCFFFQFRIKLWNLDESTGSWKVEAEWKVRVFIIILSLP